MIEEIVVRIHAQLILRDDCSIQIRSQNFAGQPVGGKAIGFDSRSKPNIPIYFNNGVHSVVASAYCSVKAVVRDRNPLDTPNLKSY